MNTNEPLADNIKQKNISHLPCKTDIQLSEKVDLCERLSNESTSKEIKQGFPYLNSNCLKQGLHPLIHAKISKVQNFFLRPKLKQSISNIIKFFISNELKYPILALLYVITSSLTLIFRYAPLKVFPYNDTNIPQYLINYPQILLISLTSFFGVFSCKNASHFLRSKFPINLQIECITTKILPFDIIFSHLTGLRKNRFTWRTIYCPV